MASNLTIGCSLEDTGRVRAYSKDEWDDFGENEIEEEASSDHDRELGTIREEVEGSLFSFDFKERGEEIVYVVIGGKQSDENLSMDALAWTLNYAPSALVFLIHVFPETKFIPTPLGKLPINQVNPEQKDKYMAQERGKRRDFLQKFLNVCSASQVKVDTILIESEMEAKAILELIPILNVRKLVLGATKSAVRRMRSKKGNGVGDQIVQSAPEYCEIKIICEGKEMSEQRMTESLSSSPSPSPKAPDTTIAQDQPKIDSVACGCFKI